MVHVTWRLPCLQVASYSCTLVCQRVGTLGQCISTAELALSQHVASYKGNGQAVKRGMLTALRQWLYVRAMGVDAPLPDSCPVLHAEACFDVGCPLAARVGLLAVSTV